MPILAFLDPNRREKELVLHHGNALHQVRLASADGLGMVEGVWPGSQAEDGAEVGGPSLGKEPVGTMATSWGWLGGPDGGHNPFLPIGWMASFWRWAVRSRRGCQPSTGLWPCSGKSSSPQTPDTKVGTPGRIEGEPLSRCPVPGNSSVCL